MESVIKKLGKTSITVEKDYHSSEKEYNKLTVVEEQGTFKTYLSRKPVPVGIEITNREYWIPFSGIKESLIIDYEKFKKEINNNINSIVTAYLIAHPELIVNVQDKSINIPKLAEDVIDKFNKLQNDIDTEADTSRVNESTLNQYISTEIDRAKEAEVNIQKTLENITKTGEASAASNVTYVDNIEFGASNLQDIIDKVGKKVLNEEEKLSELDQETDKTNIQLNGLNITDNDFFVGKVYRMVNGVPTLVDYGTSRLRTKRIPVKEGQIFKYRIGFPNNEDIQIIAFNSNNDIVDYVVFAETESTYTVPNGASYIIAQGWAVDVNLDYVKLINEVSLSENVASLNNQSKTMSENISANSKGLSDIKGELGLEKRVINRDAGGSAVKFEYTCNENDVIEVSLTKFEGTNINFLIRGIRDDDTLFTIGKLTSLNTLYRFSILESVSKIEVYNNGTEKLEYSLEFRKQGIIDNVDFNGFSFLLSKYDVKFAENLKFNIEKGTSVSVKLTEFNGEAVNLLVRSIDGNEFHKIGKLQAIGDKVSYIESTKADTIQIYDLNKNTNKWKVEVLINSVKDKVNSLNKQIEDKHIFEPQPILIPVMKYDMVSGTDMPTYFRLPVMQVLNNGDILVVAEARPGEADSSFKGQFALSKSTDGGKSFKLKYINEQFLCFVYDKINDVVFGTSLNHIWKSEDHGDTWIKLDDTSASYVIPEGFSKVVYSANSGIQLQNGILAYSLCAVNAAKDTDVTNGCIFVMYSKDFGATWQQTPATQADVIANENIIVEYEPNQIMINARGGIMPEPQNLGNNRRVFVSNRCNENKNDWQITSWELEPISDGKLSDSICNATLYKANIAGHEMFLFANVYNPNSVIRKNIALFVSADAKHWSIVKLLTPREEVLKGYCALSSYGDSIYFVYETLGDIVFENLDWCMGDIISSYIANKAFYSME